MEIERYFWEYVLCRVKFNFAVFKLMWYCIDRRVGVKWRRILVKFIILYSNEKNDKEEIAVISSYTVGGRSGDDKQPKTN